MCGDEIMRRRNPRSVLGPVIAFEICGRYKKRQRREQ
jgi:hypothetical protein